MENQSGLFRWDLAACLSLYPQPILTPCSPFPLPQGGVTGHGVWGRRRALLPHLGLPTKEAFRG